MTVVYFNGQFLLENQVTIPFADRGFLFGDGLFTSVRVQEGRAECLTRHFERLNAQARFLKIEPPSLETRCVEELIRANRAEVGIWRLKIVMTGGCSPALRLSPRKGALIMFLTPYTEEAAAATLCLYPEPVLRPLAKIKTLSYLDQLFVKEYAVQKGADDAIVTSPEGYWLETACANLFWRSGDRLYTPSREQSLLPGIALGLVTQAATSLGIKMEPRLATHILPEAQLYLCNSLMGIRPVLQVEGVPYLRDEAFENQLRAQFEREKVSFNL